MKKIITLIALVTMISAESVYRKNEYGINQKVGEYRDTYNGKSYYEKGTYGIIEEKRRYKKEYNGAIGVYEKNSYGLWVKVGEIK